MKHRYFVTDDTHIGDLIIGELNSQEMLILLGKLAVENQVVSEITSLLVSKFGFIIEGTNLSFSQINSDDLYPYTYYDLISERVNERDGYLYSNICKIKEYYAGVECEEMLRSIDLDNILKNDFC
ncbi:hypothetical protein SAMN02910447_03322 [Ruminococcus sp. YE71]|nr:hypothetical protein SAMN02910446_03391 [Ruminococcus sp. YE78]SFW50949.1 hypothetical protein SAMN02910447_03322 [Ruminococcus sp. YE71]